MTIEGHIENLKAMASDMPSDKCSDWIESLMAGINAMEELKSHREAWDKVKSELWMEGMNMTGEYQGVWIRYRDIERVIDANRPKEGDNNDN